MKSVVSILCLLVSIPAFSQKFSVGPAFGFHIRNNIGINEIADSIISIADGSRAMHNVYSIFSEYQVNKLITLKGAINLTNQFSGYIVYNKWDTSFFELIEKAQTIRAINFSLELIPQLRIPIPSELEIYFIAGIRTNVNIPQKVEDISFRNGTRHQGLAEAMNHMDETIKPLYLNSVFGLKLSWRRIVIYGVIDRNLGKSFTNDLSYYGQNYAFLNRTTTLTVTAGYKLFRFGKPEDQLRSK